MQTASLAELAGYKAAEDRHLGQIPQTLSCHLGTPNKFEGKRLGRKERSEMSKAWELPWVGLPPGAWAAGGCGAVDESRTQLLLAMFVAGLILAGRVSLVSPMQILARCPRLLMCCLPFDTG